MQENYDKLAICIHISSYSLIFAGGEGVAMAQIMNYYQYPKSGMGNVNLRIREVRCLFPLILGIQRMIGKICLLLLMSLPLGMR